MKKAIASLCTLVGLSFVPASSSGAIFDEGYRFVVCSVSDPACPPGDPNFQRAREYRVQPNDNLWNISKQYYGTGFRWTDIAKSNGIKDPNMLPVNMQLSIPY